MWQTIESDPGLFFELVEKLGVKNVDFEELLEISPEVLRSFPDLHGVIFLFKYRTQQESSDLQTGEYSHNSDLFFAQQVVNNACGTLAILNLLMNSEKVELGKELEELKGFVSDFDPQIKGEAIANSEKLKSAHNSMAPVQAFEDEDPSAKNNDDDGLFHYVAYVCKNNRVYMLDGLRPAVVDLGPQHGDEAEALAGAIQDRIAQFDQGEVRFNALAVVGDRLQALRDQGNELEASQLLQKRQDWYQENSLRRQSYTGLALELIKQIAKGSSDEKWSQLLSAGQLKQL